MSQGCASGDVRLLTPAELDALRDEEGRPGIMKKSPFIL